MEITLENGFLTGESLSSLGGDLFRFIVSIQRPRLRDESWRNAMSRAGAELATRAASVRQAFADRHKALADVAHEAAESLAQCARELSEGESAARLAQIRRGLSRTYEALLFHIRALEPEPASALRHLKPTNYYRNVFHVATGLLAVVLYQFVLTKTQALAILLGLFSLFTSLEISRRFSDRWNDFLVDRVFSMIVRPRERFRPNAATYYLAALCLMTAICPKTALELGILVLAFGDPAASLAGRRFGRKKIWREKSFVGTGTFFGVSLLTCLVFLALAAPATSLSVMIVASLTTAAAGAATELASQRINDNFTIPVVCAGIASFWF